MKKALVLVALLSVGWIISRGRGPVSLGPGIYVPAEPRQSQISNAKPFDFKKATITPLANFELRAKVLSRKRYRMGWGADLSPLDLALGWKKMSDETILSEIKISQGRRWYFWRSKKLPISSKTVSNNSANMHLIPADRPIKRRMLQAREGEIIQLKGKLVEVTYPDGKKWRSSLSRSDTGDHSCEVIFVESFEKLTF